MRMDDPRYDEIKKAVDQLLKVNSNIKRKKKSSAVKQKELFANIILAIQAIETRTVLLSTELKLDFHSYDEMFLQIIDSLILLHFGKEGYEVISWYLYEKHHPDGSVDDLFDDNGVKVPSETIDDIWNLLQTLKQPEA